MPQWFAEPNNAADTTINLAISGNRLVSILNTLDQLMYSAGNYVAKDNSIVATSPYYTELYKLTEAIRDELSEQRLKARK